MSRKPNPPKSDEFPIVAIGASAGGFEAFSKLLQQIPADTGMAFIFVQHLDPTHESIVSELLSRMTKMWVGEAHEEMLIQPNHVYIMPPNKVMALRDGHLKLTPRSETPGRHMPVDHFFRAMAEVYGSRAIGVVLSGNASDGTHGVRAIKSEGGLTFAQEPSTAKFEGMPRSAIASECVDFVLPVEDIGRELARLGKHPYVLDQIDKSTADESDNEKAKLSDATEFDRICLLLKKLSGVDFKYYKDTTVRRRIARRMVVNKIEKLTDYVKMIQENRVEAEALYQDILIKVTRFFRDPDAFDFLKNKVFPALFENRAPDTPIRIWVPGCSSGEEVYSIAICLLEYMGDLATNPSIQIFATDVSEVAIQSAREGKYLENIAMDVSPERLRRFFVHLDGTYQISKPIRDLCVFAKQNMTSDPPFSKLDLISCRNVLIYLDTRLQKRVIPLFHYALKPSGYLMLGSSETIGSFGELFTLVDKHHKVYAKKAAASRMHMDFTSHYTGEHTDISHPVRELIHEENWRVQDAQRDADRIILNRYSAAGVVVDHDMEIVQFRGDTNPFLEHLPGDPSLNLLKMARNGLALELRAFVHEAKASGGITSKDNIVITERGQLRTLRIEVSPLHVPGAKGSFFLILFEESGKEAPTKEVPPPSRDIPTTPVEVLQRRNDQLTAELSATKQHLQSIIEEQEATNEELQSAHEEVLSSNEELQSINEELETAKEELQSTNEELTTVNEELQNRNLELSMVNNDLTNLLSSVNIPIVMLGSDLRIRRFTPLAEKLLSLIATDIGRPISDIKPRINVPDLEVLVAEVVDTVTTKELDVQDKEGRWYSMRIRPYKTRENKIEGAVLALLDVDALRRSLKDTEATLPAVTDAIIQTVREPVLIVDFDFKVKKANHAFEKEFKTQSNSIQGQVIFDILSDSWDSKQLRKILDGIRKREFVEGEMKCTMNGKSQMVAVSARRYEFPVVPSMGSIVLAINCQS